MVGFGRDQLTEASQFAEALMQFLASLPRIFCFWSFQTIVHAYSIIAPDMESITLEVPLRQKGNEEQASRGHGGAAGT